MERITTVFSFVFYQDRMIMTVDLTWNGEPIHMALSSLMTFIFEHEAVLDKNDAAFCYTLAKLIKKVQLGRDFYLAIPDDTDMAIFFKRAIALKIPLLWKNGNATHPLKTEFPLPLTFQVASQFNGILSCTLLDHISWATNPLGWLMFEFNNQRMCFCNGTLIENLPKDLEDFVSLFLDNPRVQYKDQESIKFIHQVYSPHKKRVYWQVQADFAAILPQETTPIPVLTISTNGDSLSPTLTYQYGSTIVEPTYKGSFVKDHDTTKYYKRMPELELIYQDDLIALFSEHDLAFMLQTAGDIALFLDIVVPILQDRGWVVENKAKGFKIDSEPMSLDFAIKSSGTDWFYFEPTIQLGEQRMALMEVARLMVDNKGYFKTKSGYVRLDSQSMRELKSLNQMGAFKVGQKFTRAEMVPFATTANLSGQSPEASQWLSQIDALNHHMTCVPGKSFNGQLRDYQQYGLNWLHFLQQAGLGGILADDMGLGKTIQAIAFCSQLEGPHPVLVVGPTNVVYNWKNEIAKFMPSAKVVVYTGAGRQSLQSKVPKADFVITTFGLIKNDEEWLSSLTFKAIFVDEAQYIKNPNAQISKAIKTLQSPFRLAMTGTPIENHLQDLWNLFDFAMPNYLSTKREFDCLVKDEKLSLIKARVKPFILRREKREVLQSLPEKTEITLQCSMSTPQRQLYETVLMAVKQGIKNSVGKRERMHVLTSLLKLRQVCTHPGLIAELKGQDIESAKFDLAKETILNLIEEDHKIVLFSQFTSMLNIFETWTKQEKIYTERIDGQVTGKARSVAVDRFQAHEGAGLFLISLKAGGVGINLTSADYVIHMDAWWNPAVEAQATDRVHRMGQQNKVIVYKLITEGTIEEKIAELQESKRALLSQVIDIDTLSEKAIDFKELAALLG